MSKTTKAWLITATSLIIIGLIVFSSVMTVYGWDFTKLSTIKYQTNTYSLSDEFGNISIITDTADIILVPSEDGKCKVVCYEDEKEKHSVTVQNGVLTVKLVDERKWYDHIGISISTPKITLYLPGSKYGELTVKTDTGDVEVPNAFKFKGINISASTGDIKNYASALETVSIKTSTGSISVEGISSGALDLSVSTGKVLVKDVSCEGKAEIKASTGKTKITNLKCKNLVSNGSTGDINLKNVFVTEKLNIERDTGDLKLDECDAAEILIKTDTGDVKGTLLTSKVFIANSDTGDVDVPKTVTGGKCEIYTDTGDIKIKISPD